MGILDDIANPRVANPLAAFLVGKENRRQVARQERLDEQSASEAQQIGELRGLKIDQLRNAPIEAKALKEAELAEKQRQSAIIITAIDAAKEAGTLEPNKADTAKRLIAAGNDKDAIKILTASSTAGNTNEAREIQIVDRINQENERAGRPPISLQEYIREKNGTSGPIQAYEAYKADGGTQSFEDFSKRFASNTSGSKTLGTKGFEKLDTMATDASGSQKAVNTISEAGQLIEDGIRTGTIASGRNAAARALDTVLGRNTDEEALSANTDAYIANAGSLVGQVIKQFGSGTGLSDADREYAERMAAGSITVNEGALKRILEIQYKVAKFQIDKFNKRLDSISEQFPEAKAFYDKIEIPSKEDALPWLKDKDNDELSAAELEELRLRREASGAK